VDIAFVGDTAPHPPLVEHVRGVALLIHEASFGPRPASEPNSALHSGAPDAARLAREAQVQRLALVHCSEREREAALEAARRLFPNTFFAEEGQTLRWPE
jgi:ribonuclease Z